jgi:hypothetical protein
MGGDDAAMGDRDVIADSIPRRADLLMFTEFGVDIIDYVRGWASSPKSFYCRKFQQITRAFVVGTPLVVRMRMM